MTTITYKVANEEHEFEQIHRLNHRTFAEEIPQRPRQPDLRLVDRFHAENHYIIGLDGPRLIAMVALRGRRPFSLDEKLHDLDYHIPPGSHPCEIRLLAIEREVRGRGVFVGLLGRLADEFIRSGYNLALASGTVRQQRLYAHLGFVPFGPRVGSPEALFQPMSLSLGSFRLRARTLLSKFPHLSCL
jgi:GNAT superfamily N-acetyltransferase